MTDLTTTSRVSEYGRVVAIQHPLVTIDGLPSVSPGELLEFSDQSLGQVISFDKKYVQAMSLNKEPIRVGDNVTPLKKSASIPVSQQVLGKIINPLAKGILTEINWDEKTDRFRLDKAPPPLSSRKEITHPLRTGSSIVDLLIPLAKGQREIITGDRNTGKSSFGLKLIKTQIEEGSIVVYGAIAKRRDEIIKMHGYLQKHNLVEKVVIVASFPNDPASLITLTPFSAMTVAEYFRNLGQDVLLILDDLSTHAEMYRELSLINRSFPGRDSYPGDIFYLHARLLERAGTIAHPSNPAETVSISCLPLAETTDNDLTDYIISNLISITDGHLLFDTSLFQRGRRPALNPALSVTRVGKQTQTSLQRALTRELTTFLTQYEKTRKMTHFAAELSQDSQIILRRGAQLWTFFTETTDLIIPFAIQAIFVSLIWQNWLVNIKNRTLMQFRDKLAENYYENEEAKKEFDKIIEVTNFKELLEKTKAKQQWLLRLCQA